MSNLANTTSADGTANDGAGNEFLAFTLGSEEYGIDILKVQEIRGYESATRMANAPAYILGVLNLRGVIVPVIDMRLLRMAIRQEHKIRIAYRDAAGKMTERTVLPPSTAASMTRPSSVSDTVTEV